jgi:hypothetical protein
VPLTVRELRDVLATCGDDDLVVIAAALSDGAVIGVRDLLVGTDQGGIDGEGFELVVSWEPGTEVVTRP